MNKTKIKKILSAYDKKLKEAGYACEKANYDKYVNYDDDDFNESLSHFRWMISQMDEFIREGKMDKVFRWLGFIQGCLWAGRIYTISEMKTHNRK